MNTNFNNVVRTGFESMLIAANSASIERAKFGFINKDCDFVKSMLGSICIHALDNKDIFTKSQYNNIVNLINNISHGR